MKKEERKKKKENLFLDYHNKQIGSKIVNII